MLTSLRLVDFKNFRDETLHMGPLTVIVGANASGKSNLRDAFRFLHGIGRGYTLGEIIGGKYGTGGQQEWAQIRGAADEIIRFGQPALMLQVKAPGIAYSIRVARSKEHGGVFRVTKEELKDRRWTTTYTSHPPEMSRGLRRPRTTSRSGGSDYLNQNLINVLPTGTPGRIGTTAGAPNRLALQSPGESVAPSTHRCADALAVPAGGGPARRTCRAIDAGPQFGS